MRTSSHVMRVFFFTLLLVGLVVAALMTVHPSQQPLGWMLCGLFIVLAVFQSPNKLFLRVLLFSLGAFLTLRYLFFRFFFTLFLDSPLSMILAIILFLAECYAIAIHFSGLFVSLYPKDRPAPPLPEHLPSVDIFIPTYNEDPDVTVTTALACKGLEYPEHLVHVYILDDGCKLPRLNDPKLQPELLQRHATLKRQAEAAGVTYLTRADGEKAKAGMLNTAFRGQAFMTPVQAADGVFTAGDPVKTRGNLILILDCDHIPARDFLTKTVGHFFADPKLFMVQTPHFMINADPLRKNYNDTVNLPCESWLFYRNVQRGLDRWGAAFFCGSAALLRRTMLEETDGLHGDTITEDCETSLALHGRGYTSAYVSMPLIAGLAPESVTEMIKQRQRWCQGMLQIILLKNPLMQRGLRLSQRLGYLNSCMFWLFPLSRLIFLVAPLMFLLFNINIYSASVEQVIAFAGPHIAASLMLSIIVHGKLRPFLHSEVLETIQSVFLVPAIASVFLHPKKPIFMITRKGVTMEKDAPSPLALPFFILFLLLLAGFIRGGYIWVTNPLLHDTIYVTFFWNIFNMLIVLGCIGAVWERKQRRTAHRVRVEEPVQVDAYPVTLTNLSHSGVHFHAGHQSFNPGQTCVFSTSLLTTPLQIVRVDNRGVAGVFTETSPNKAIINYVYGDSRRWSKVMDDVLKGHGGYARQSWNFITDGLRSSVDSFAAILRKMAFWAVIAGAVCLMPQAGFADSFERTVASLTQMNEFRVDAEQGELRIPFYLSKRSIFHSVTLSLVYTRSEYLPPLPGPMYVVIDEARVEGEVHRTGNDEYTMVFQLPQEKIVAGNRLAVLRVEQTLPEPLDLAAKNLSPQEPGPWDETGNPWNSQNIQATADSGAFWTVIDLRRSHLNIDYTLREMTPAERTDFDFIFNEQTLTPKKLHLALPELTPAMTVRAFSTVQNVAMALGDRPLNVTASNTVSTTSDCIIIGDNARELLAATPSQPLYVMLAEQDIPTDIKVDRHILEMGTTQTFKALGLDSLTFHPWYASHKSRFLIPTPTNLTPNRSLKITLDFMYSPGLHKSSRLEVHVNQEILTRIPLSNPDGMRQHEYSISVPTTLLTKGYNTLTINPVLIPLSGKSWNNSEDDLFVTVFNDSSFTLPHVGSYVRIPDLYTITTDSYPFAHDTQVFLSRPTYGTVAALLTFSAQVAQHRGSPGRNVEFFFDRWIQQPRNTMVFTLDNSLPPKTMTLTATLIPETRDKLLLEFKAATGEDMEKGVSSLWNYEVQKQIHGNQAVIEYETGQVKTREGKANIISDTGPLPNLAYYANNFPLHTAGIIIVVILLFALSGYLLARKAD